VTFAI